jgi:hypothetical protein
VGLHRSEPEFAADALELLAHVDHGPVQVDVIPAQAEGLAPAEPAEREQDEGRVQRVCLAGGQELAGLAGGPGPDRRPVPFGQLGAAGDVAGDQLLAHGSGER